MTCIAGSDGSLFLIFGFHAARSSMTRIRLFDDSLFGYLWLLRSVVWDFYNPNRSLALLWPNDWMSWGLRQLGVYADKGVFLNRCIASLRAQWGSIVTEKRQHRWRQEGLSARNMLMTDLGLFLLRTSDGIVYFYKASRYSERARRRPR